MIANEDIKEFSIKELFEQTDSYIIPIYQRNYAWKKVQIEQLIKDIDDYKSKNKNYYIGTLVVFEKIIEKQKVFETIDGQQRLTTLSILLSVLKNEFEKDFIFNHILSYESRDISTQTLQDIYSANVQNNEQLNPAMKNAYTVIKNYLKKEIIDINIFYDYLVDNVKILRVNVPKDTDLNHYFEIMNSRGEQLEKHEVLKARMLSQLKDDDSSSINTFNLIWETCSDMYRYVQYGFSVEVRDKIFGSNWNSFNHKDFEDIKEKINISTTQNKDYSIDDIIDNKHIIDSTTSKKEDDKPDRFISPINFQNFLLHVWKITQDKNVALDDKGLLDNIIFKNNNNDDENSKIVKNFGFNLLKLRFLFDNYIIKREYVSDTDKWSLKKLIKNNNIQYNNSFGQDDNTKNKQIIMLLSMFHVSNPSPTYKYWLTAVLNHLNKKYDNKINEDKYINYLEELANIFFKRYLSKNKNKIDYNNIIFSSCSFSYIIDKSLLNQGTAVEHFIFNYLDYLLWKNDKNKFNYFNFSFSNSVEHFYPQHPIEGYIPLKSNIDDFGNLCLISVNKNAKLNNHPPKSKKAYYNNEQYDSIKQHIMMEDADNWNEDNIKKHQDDMLKTLGITK